MNRLFACFAAMLLSVGAFCQDHPNFTGVWKLDATRSQIASQSPESVTLYIHQNDPDFHLRRTQTDKGKSWAWSVHGRTDGKTLEQKTREGVNSTHMYWQGSQLVLEWKNSGKQGSTQKVLRYSLEDGGSTLIAQDESERNKLVFKKGGKS